MPRRGRRRTKTRTHAVDNDTAQSALLSAESLKVPKSLVIRRGKSESEVSELVDDVRKIMMPFTALNFQESVKNRKHTLGVYARELAQPMGVSHILAFTQSSRSEKLNLRLARVPEGPTMTFRVGQFSLSKHVRAIQRRPFSGSHKILQQPPIVVTNNFGDQKTAEPHVKLMRITFQNMFPAINVATVKLGDCKRVVLFNYIQQEEGAGMVEVRHYAIKATPVGVDRKVRRIIQANKIPNLGNMQDIADYITGTRADGTAATTSAGNVSDSEPEDESAHVMLMNDGSSKHKKSRGGGNSKSALKLVELGPRLTLQLIKVERGLGGGDVMYHALYKKTPEEARELKERKVRQEKLKQQRREEQEQNVNKKRKLKDEKLARKKARIEERERETMSALRRGQDVTLNDDDDDDDESNDDDDDDDDASSGNQDSDDNEEESESDDNEE